jgi:predicted aspartyl protease
VPTGRRAYELATGARIEFEVGYAEFSFMGDTIQTRVIFGPDKTEPILGAVALELAGMVVDPVNQILRKLPALPLK